MKKLVGLGIVLLLLLGGCTVGLPFLLGLGGSIPIQQSTAAGCSNQTNAAPASVHLTSASFDASQLHFAAIIAGVAITRRLPQRDAAIALATAMQESSLENPVVPSGGSLGLFQQISADGWGSPDQETNPINATNMFLDALVKVPNLNSLSITEAAQAVQHSKFPGKYAKWGPVATTLAADAYKGVKLSDTSPVTAVLTSCTSTAAQLTAATTPVLQKIVSAALSQVGDPYVWGGNTPKRSGFRGAFDCSGLVFWSYQQAGIQLPRVANGQYIASPVKFTPKLSLMRPGDLLFEQWDEEGPGTGWGHVGMYIGNGKVIEAPQRGEDVKIMSFQAFGALAAGRPLPSGR